ncbi:MAG: hypothetical protein K6E10_08730 [Eubacterium sp.]|nr:hypothetical protein [Eubacterium sp.]
MPDGRLYATKMNEMLSSVNDFVFNIDSGNYYNQFNVFKNSLSNLINSSNMFCNINKKSYCSDVNGESLNNLGKEYDNAIKSLKEYKETYLRTSQDRNLNFIGILLYMEQRLTADKYILSTISSAENYKTNFGDAVKEYKTILEANDKEMSFDKESIDSNLNYVKAATKNKLNENVMQVKPENNNQNNIQMENHNPMLDDEINPMQNPENGPDYPGINTINMANQVNQNQNQMGEYDYPGENTINMANQVNQNLNQMGEYDYPGENTINMANQVNQNQNQMGGFDYPGENTINMAYQQNQVNQNQNQMNGFDYPGLNTINMEMARQNQVSQPQMEANVPESSIVSQYSNPELQMKSDKRAEKDMQIMSIATLLARGINATARNNEKTNKPEWEKLRISCKNFYNSVKALKNPQTEKYLAPNSGELKKLRNQAETALNNVDVLLEKCEKSSQTKPSGLFYINIIREKIMDDYHVLKSMKPGKITLSQAAKKYGELPAKYGYKANNKPLNYLGDKNQKIDVKNININANEKTGTLQVFSTLRLIKKATGIVKAITKNGDANAEKIAEMEKNFRVLFDYMKPYNLGNNRKPISEEKLELAKEGYKFVIKELKGWKSELSTNCNLSNKSGQDLLFTFDILNDKLEDDLNVLSVKTPDIDLAECVKRNSKLPSHYGLLDDKISPIPFSSGATKRPGGNLGELYSFDKDGIKNVIADVHNLAKSLKANDHTFMYNKKKEYSDLRTHVEKLDRWVSSFKDLLTDPSKSSKRDYEKLLGTFSIKVNMAMNDAKNYLEKKEAERIRDNNKGIDRVNLPSKAKREQPRIRTALHVYETFEALQKMYPNTFVNKERNARIEVYREKLLSKDSKKLFEEEKKVGTVKPAVKKTAMRK